MFGLAGFVLPLDEVMGFATWFFQRKCQLLAFEIDQSGKHPALWEKKGSSLYTIKNVKSYPELRNFTNRLLNKIAALNGFVFFVGIAKTAPVGSRDLEDGALASLTLRDGRTVTIATMGSMANLAGPRPLGNSIEAMDFGFALQAKCLERVASGTLNADHCIVPVPRDIDEWVANSYLRLRYQ